MYIINVQKNLQTYFQLKHPEWKTCDPTQPGNLWTDKETEDVRAKVAG
jgi:hypothetical protein